MQILIAKEFSRHRCVTDHYFFIHWEASGGALGDRIQIKKHTLRQQINILSGGWATVHTTIIIAH